MDVHKVYRIFQDRFRPKRMRRMADLACITAKTKVLDVGGSPLNWDYLLVKPDLTIINIDPMDPSPDLRQVIGDGCQLPFADDTFDLVFSNSVIEHVPDHNAFAREAARVGRSYYVQTPNYWFPIEPHFLAPLIHFLPAKWRTKIARHFTGWGIIAKPTPLEVSNQVSTTNLLTVAQMQDLFPQGKIERERFCGITKSVIIVGGAIAPS